VHQAPLSMGFSRQEHWSGVPLPSPIYDYMCVYDVYVCVYAHTNIYIYVCIYTLNLAEIFEATGTRMKDRRLVKMLECRLDRMCSFG